MTGNNRLYTEMRSKNIILTLDGEDFIAKSSAAQEILDLLRCKTGRDGWNGIEPRNNYWKQGLQFAFGWAKKI